MNPRIVWRCASASFALALAIVFIALAPRSALAAQPVDCPIWDTLYPSPEAAGYAWMVQHYSAGCFAAPMCVPWEGGATVYNCTAASTNPQTCGSSPYFATVYGYASAPLGIYLGTVDGKYYCVAFPPDDPKNKGDPDDCPKCGKGEGKGKGNPVNITTGNKFQSEVDFAGTADGTLTFARAYNSVLPGPPAKMGFAWTHTYSRSLLFTNSKIWAYRADGRILTFSLSGSLWIGDGDMPEQLVSLGAGGWQLTTADDEVETYAPATGKLTSITDRLGRITTFSYSDGTTVSPGGGTYEGTTTPLPIGFLIRAQDHAGRTLQLSYITAGLLRRVIDPTGGAYVYSYDTSVVVGKLTSVQYPNGATRTYIYNESANTSGANLPYALTGITDENGDRFATYKYATNGKPISTEHAGGNEKYLFTYNSGSTTYVDPLGTTYTSNYSTIKAMNQVTGTTRVCTGCGGTTTETHTFDANRNQTSYKDFKGNLSCFSYGIGRNLETARTEGLSGSGTCASRITTSATRTITTEWHPTWRLPKRIAEPLKITTFHYHGETGVSCAPSGAATTLLCSKDIQATTDADGSLAFTATADGAARTSSYTYNSFGKVLTVDGPRSDVTDVTTYAYFASNDPSGNYLAGDLSSITNAKGQVTQFTQYDGAGRLKKTVDANGVETLLEYWPRGWLKLRKVGTASAGYETTSYDYDSVGQLTRVTMPDGSFVQYTYDAAHRLWKINDGLGNRIEYVLDYMGNRVSEAAYDTGNALVRAHSRVISGLNLVYQDVGGTTPSTQITQNTFDANKNLTSILDPLGRTTTQDFDALNRLTAVKDPFNGTANPTSYQYNRQGALTQVTDPTGLATTYTLNGHGETLTQVSPDTGTTTFTYNAASSVATRTDARSIQATFSYDELNRVTQIAYPDETQNFAYDTCTNGVGRLCSITDRAGTTNFTYDLWGRVASKSQTVGTLTQSMGYSYNASGQLATVTTPSGRQVVYSYSNNRPASITVDGVNVLNSVFYEPFGPNGGWKWGNSTQSVPNTHTRVFDKDFRMTRVTSDLPTSGTQPYFDRQVGWDNQSRVASITDLANSALSATYGYEALDHLTSTTQGSSTWGYSFNGIGDRLTSTVGAASTNYGYYSGTHRLQTLSGAQTKAYTFDAAGNITSDGLTVWVYGGNNRALSAGLTTFLINSLGQRVKKDNTISATRFVFDEMGRLWGEYSDSGALIQETVWLDDLPVATLRPNGSGVDIFYVHPDHLGTPRAITRPNDNQFVWKWDNTEPFGNSAPDENPSGLGTFAYNLRFQGQYYDAETGKHYNYFRDYDPTIGRYLQSDPIGLRAGLNTYAYVDGNPLSLLDQLGLASKPPICSGKDCPDPPLCPTPDGPKPCPQPGPSKPGKDRQPQGEECAKQPLIENCIQCCAFRNRFTPHNITPCIETYCTKPRGITCGDQPTASS